MGHAERGDGDAHDVYNMADPAVDAVADEGIQQGPKRQGQTFAIGEVGQAQADQGENRPWMKAPMEQGYPHGHARGFICQPLGKGVVGVMQHWLGDGPEDQADTHPGAE
ncbi:hypothetical protein D9M71_549300 [compost metagenome]